MIRCEPDNEMIQGQLKDELKASKSFKWKIMKNKAKVRDHDHLTEEYRAPAHSIFNLHYQIANIFP